MSAIFSPERSAALPVIPGTIAPPTIAMQMTPDPSAVRLPRPSLARVKIVGNMMELNRPMASKDPAENCPTVLAEISSSAMTAAAAQESTLPGEKRRNT